MGAVIGQKQPQHLRKKDIRVLGMYSKWKRFSLCPLSQTPKPGNIQMHHLHSVAADDSNSTCSWKQKNVWEWTWTVSSYSDVADDISTNSSKSSSLVCVLMHRWHIFLFVSLYVVHHVLFSKVLGTLVILI